MLTFCLHTMKNFIKTNYSKVDKMMNKKAMLTEWGWVLGLILGLLALIALIAYFIVPSVPRIIGVLNVI